MIQVFRLETRNPLIAKMLTLGLVTEAKYIVDKVKILVAVWFQIKVSNGRYLDMPSKESFGIEPTCLYKCFLWDLVRRQIVF